MLCREHSRCTHCENLVSCEGTFDPNYQILINDAGDYQCVDSDECTTNRCACDVELATSVANYTKLKKIDGFDVFSNNFVLSFWCLFGCRKRR